MWKLIYVLPGFTSWLKLFLFLETIRIIGIFYSLKIPGQILAKPWEFQAEDR